MYTKVYLNRLIAYLCTVWFVCSPVQAQQPNLDVLTRKLEHSKTLAAFSNMVVWPQPSWGAASPLFSVAESFEKTLGQAGWAETIGPDMGALASLKTKYSLNMSSVDIGKAPDSSLATVLAHSSATEVAQSKALPARMTQLPTGKMAVSMPTGQAAPQLPVGPLSAPPLVTTQSEPQSRLLHVRRLVDQVLARHPELYQAEAESRSAESQLRARKAGYQPQTSVNSSFGLERQTIDATQRSLAYKQRQLQLRINQALYDPVLAAQIEQNRALSVGADWQLTGVREQLMARTLELYIELLRHETLSALAREHLQNHRRYVGQIKDIARADLGRSADLPAANARVALAESVLVSRIARLDATRVQWTQLSGLPSPLSTTDTLDAQQLPMPKLAGHVDALVALAVEGNPALFKARADIDAAEQNARAVAAGFLPKISADISWRQGQDISGIQGKQKDLYLGVSLDWKLPLNGLRKHQDLAANEAVVAAQYAKEKLQQDLAARVHAQWYELLAAEASLKSFEAYVVSAQEVVQAYQAQFKIGRRSLLDLLNAENELFTARSNASTTRQDITLNAWRLSALAGKLREELGL